MPNGILLDQNAPLGLRRSLAPREVVAARQMGWSTLANGDLLQAAEEDGFDILITCDRNIPHQQNLSKRRIAAIDVAAPGSYKIVTIPPPPLRRRPYARPVP